MSDGIAGFSADTEILTRTQGWVTFDRLAYTDEVATRSPGGLFEWQSPERISVESYEGDLVHLHSRTTDLLVMPETRIPYMKRRQVTIAGKRHDEYDEQMAAAGSVVGQRLSLVATSRWEPVTAPTAVSFTATRAQTYGGRLANRGRDFAATALDFAAFMGMYLAEGNLSSPSSPGYYIWIWQNRDGRGFAEYDDLLARLFGRQVPHDPKKGQWHFSHKALSEYVRNFGSYAWTKVVPPEVLDLAAADLGAFWHYYWLGDGTLLSHANGRKPIEQISTTSPVMAGQFQEILQKLGTWSVNQVVDFSKYLATSQIGAKTARPCYRITRRAGEVAFATYIERSAYDGTVGYAEVRGRPVYVRRNNRPVWAGGTLH